jgi:hypothetical protein
MASIKTLSKGRVVAEPGSAIFRDLLKKPAHIAPILLGGRELRWVPDIFCVFRGKAMLFCTYDTTAFTLVSSQNLDQRKNSFDYLCRDDARTRLSELDGDG